MDGSWQPPARPSIALVPANAVLTIAGQFDPGVARRLVEDGLVLAPQR